MFEVALEHVEAVHDGGGAPDHHLLRLSHVRPQLAMLGGQLVHLVLHRGVPLALVRAEEAIARRDGRRLMRSFGRSELDASQQRRWLRRLTAHQAAGEAAGEAANVEERLEDVEGRG